MVWRSAGRAAGILARMVVPVVAVLIGLLAVLVALSRDREAAAHAVTGPDWDPLPEPADLARVTFPRALPGYDPATVEVTFETLIGAYVDLYAAAPPDVRERARRRAAARTGVEIPPAPEGPAEEGDILPPSGEPPA
jgi:hypothetical protein